MFRQFTLSILFISTAFFSNSQLRWKNVDHLYGQLPGTVHVFKTTDSLDGNPNIAYYVIADLTDKDLVFDVDTTLKRRLRPSEYFLKNDQPVVVVNTTFFSFGTNQNLNVVMDEGKLVGYNIHSIAGRGKDTLTYRHPLGSAIGINSKRVADVAWLYTDSSRPYPLATQKKFPLIKDSSAKFAGMMNDKRFTPWKMQTAVGGGPVLIQNGEIQITNNEEWKFAGKAIDDKHPRTAMGYTKDNKLVILVVEGRHPGSAEGASLKQLAKMLREIGCIEALNLDGGGSSCMLVNGLETIKVSDPGGQRPVPAVFLIHSRD